MARNETVAGGVADNRGKSVAPGLTGEIVGKIVPVETIFRRRVLEEEIKIGEQQGNRMRTGS